MRQEKFDISETEKSALNHTGSRTVLLYFVPSFIILLIYAIISKANTSLLFMLGLVNCVLITLMVLSLRLRKKTKMKTLLFSKSIKIHMLSLFILSVFVSPFIGAININGLNEFIYGTPFNLVGAIAFGYAASCLALGVPAVLLINAIKDKRAKKQAELEKKSQI